MALKLPKLPSFARADAKTRLFVIFAVVGAIAFGGFAVYRYIGDDSGAAGPSKVAAAPSSLQSVPGGQLSPEYYRALMLQNQQAAQKAQLSGGSAVPTLVSVQQPALSTNSSAGCTVMCPGGDEAANVEDDINNLVKAGKLSQDDADKLTDLAKKNVSVAEYAAALDELVKEGKLTPEQARALLETYKKQHEHALLQESASSMDAMIKSGQLPLAVANELLEIQKKQLTPAEYAAELARLVKEGKLSPAAAAELLAQYTQQYQKERQKEAADQLMKMVKSGQLTADVAKQLIAFQATNPTVCEYSDEISRLVTAGKMTPDVGTKLVADYKKQTANVAPNAAITQLAAQGGADEAQKLLDMQCHKATLASYTEALKRAVQEGKITPAMAAALLKEYQATMQVAAARAGVLPKAQANVPGAEDFARLQQHLQAQAVAQGSDDSRQFGGAGAAGLPGVAGGAGAAGLAGAGGAAGGSQNAQQFTAAQAQAAARMAQERQQVVQEMSENMSSQAQTLLAAWQPSTMQHKDGSAAAGKDKGQSLFGASQAGSNGDKSDTKPKGPALIKGGAILFAVLDTAVDSDYPDTPVMATIVQGKFKGAKLLGKLSLAQGQDRVSLNFTMMDMDDWLSSKSISAYAIDPDTAKTVLANSVDYHYLMRYGALFGSSFLSGYASAITNAGSTTTSGVFGTSTTASPLSPKQEIIAGLGQVGTKFGTVVGAYMNVPDTVKVNSGVGLGILFVSEVAS